MSTGAVKPEERTFTDKEAEKSFAKILELVAAGVRVRIVVGGREVAIMESPMDRTDRLFRELREREANEQAEDLPFRLTRPQFFQD
jgi:antitoxin (DNA-binding transcriptional repressor) of toxin-antitoxin stability system